MASLGLLYKVQINFSKLSHERLYEKKLGAIMIEPERQKICMLQIAGKCIFQWNWRYLETPKQAHLIKTAERETLNPNNESYLVKTIWSKI